MFLLVFFLILIFFFPVLIAPFFLFLTLLILFIPFKFTFDSIFNLISVPSQIYQIATNSKLRKNHALEHATVNILEKEYGYRNLAGFAQENGFYIVGVNNLLAVEKAARQGLTLLQQGYSNLVIHKRCGTSMTVANFISALIFLILLFYTGHFSIFYIIIAIIMANLLGPFTGSIVQRYFTTTTKLEGMEIVKVDYAHNSNFFNLSKVFVQSQEIPYIES